MAKKTHGNTASGASITDELIGKLAEKAEAGHDVGEMLRRRSGRPPMGSAAATVEVPVHGVGPGSARPQSE